MKFTNYQDLINAVAEMIKADKELHNVEWFTSEGCRPGFYKETILTWNECIKEVKSYFGIHLGNHLFFQLMKLYGTEEFDFALNELQNGAIIIQNSRGRYSEYQLTIQDNIDFWRLSEEGKEIVLDEKDRYEGDFISMMLTSFVMAEEEGINAREVEPFCHMVYTTNGGHVTCTPDIPYMMYKYLGYLGENARWVRGTENLSALHFLLGSEELEKLASNLETGYELCIPQDYELLSFLHWNEAREGRPTKTFASAKHFKLFLNEYRKCKYDVKNIQEIDSYFKLQDLNYGKKVIELVNIFAKKGRLPKCIYMLAKLPMTAEEIYKQFSFKKVLEYRKQEFSLSNAVKLSYVFHPKFAVIGEKALNAVNEYKDSNPDLLKWVENHLKTAPALIEKVARHATEIDLTLPIATIKQKINRLEYPIEQDYTEIVSKYGTNFNVTKQVKVSASGMTAGTLSLATEEEIKDAIGLGYETFCCQHLDGAGETAMLYSLYHGTFLKFERKGELLGQAACWTYKNKFVLDNIEFSNDRDANCILPVLRKWLEFCPYKDVYMGTGWNEVSFGLPKFDHDDKEIGLKLPQDKRLENDDDGIYTDAHQIVQLKKEGIVLC